MSTQTKARPVFQAEDGGAYCPPAAFAQAYAVMTFLARHGFKMIGVQG